MLKPALMKFFAAVVIDSDLEKVIDVIARCGALHMVEAKKLEDWVGQATHEPSDRAPIDYLNIRERALKVLTAIGGRRTGVKNTKDFVCDGAAVKQLTAAEKELENHLRLKAQLQEKLKERQSVYEQLEAYGPSGVGRAAAGRFTFLDSFYGEIPAERLDVLKQNFLGTPLVLLPIDVKKDSVEVLVLSLKAQHDRVSQVLASVGFNPLTLCAETAGDIKQVQAAVRRDIAMVDSEIKKADQHLLCLRNDFSSTLSALAESMAIRATLDSMRLKCRCTQRTYVVSGWVPARECLGLSKAVRAAAFEPCFVDFYDAGDISSSLDLKVPVLLDNVKAIKPFEMIMTNYGLPEYGHVDPTFFVALTFIIMFGAMFGDLGQGFVFFLFGIFMIKSRHEILRKAGPILSACGFSSMVFGACYGSLFCMENVLPAIWMRPMDNIMAFLSAALTFGAVMVSLGIILNLVNAAREGDKIKFFFGKSGFLGGLIYWSIVGAIVVSLRSGDTVFAGIFYSVILCSMIALCFKAWVERAHKGGKLFPEGIFAYCIEMMIEFIEVFGGLLSNTVSFVRIGAFALAHIGVSLSVLVLADILKSSSLGSFGTIMMVVAGNIVIMILEGMGVMIQCVRLEYYEFFSKFFTGEGLAYRPVKITE